MLSGDKPGEWGLWEYLESGEEATPSPTPCAKSASRNSDGRRAGWRFRVSAMLHFGTQRVAPPSVCPALITVSPETGENLVPLRIVYRALTAGNTATQSGEREEGQGGFLSVAVMGVGGRDMHLSCISLLLPKLGRSFQLKQYIETSSQPSL